MKVFRSNDGEKKSGKTFTGHADLQFQMLPQTEGGIKVTLVTFQEGSRTHWHEHPGEQVLFILKGRGRVGNATEEWEVDPGDIVYTGPGERHWHGALPGESMTHISITNVGSPSWFDAPEDD
jgi:quercetin dioxygenase-like cupin family protein